MTEKQAALMRAKVASALQEADDLLTFTVLLLGPELGVKRIQRLLLEALDAELTR